MTVSAVAVTGGAALGVGQTTQMTATATLSSGGIQDVTATSTWASSAPAVATVAAGLVQGLTAGATSITAVFQGVGSAGKTVQVSAAPVVQAAFTVTPDARLGSNPGQCPIDTVVNPGFNTLLCTFNATSSTPSAGITSYSWEIPDGGQAFSGAILPSGSMIACSSFGGGGTRQVRLKVVAPGGNSSISIDVTFVKSVPC